MSRVFGFPSPHPLFDIPCCEYRSKGRWCLAVKPSIPWCRARYTTSKRYRVTGIIRLLHGNTTSSLRNTLVIVNSCWHHPFVRLAERATPHRCSQLAGLPWRTIMSSHTTIPRSYRCHGTNPFSCPAAAIVCWSGDASARCPVFRGGRVSDLGERERDWEGGYLPRSIPPELRRVVSGPARR